MKALFAVVLVVVCVEAAKADSAYPQLTNINTTGNGSSLQSNANMNSNAAINNTETTNRGGAANANGNGTGNVTQFDQIRQSPSVFMNAPAPTAPCQATAGGFVSFIAGGGFAASYTLEECEVRESARIAHGIGETVMAKEIMCMGKFAKLTASCKGE